jgi:thiol-disulfide isomerase/thioredoxin
MVMLLEFFGWNCIHCQNMEPLVAKLEKETGVKFQRYEVWKEENENNAKMMTEYDKGGCGGVPFFFNTETKAAICGECSYEELKEWAAGKSKK